MPFNVRRLDLNQLSPVGLRHGRTAWGDHQLQELYFASTEVPSKSIVYGMRTLTTMRTSTALPRTSSSHRQATVHGERNMLKHAVAIGAVVLLLGSAASARERSGIRACVADVKSLCADVEPGEGRIRDCVKSNFAKLSEPCQAGIAKAAAVVKACKPDVKQLCSDVKRGGGRIAKCMRSHLADIQDQCTDALSDAVAGKK